MASDEKGEEEGEEGKEESKRKGKLTLVVNDVWDFPSQTSFAWKQSEAENDPSTYFAGNLSSEKKNFVDNNNNNVNKKEILERESNNLIVNNNKEEEEEDEEEEEEEINNNNNGGGKKIVYEWCVVDEERIRKINAQKRKKMIAARKAKTVRRPPTVHIPSPLTQSTSY